MKELKIEEKAERYDKAIRIANEYWKSPRTCIDINVLAELFTELKESEDERVRKWLIAQLELKSDVNNSRELELMILKSIAWLEKQGEPTDINPSEFDLRLNKLLKQFETLPKEELASCLSFYLNVVQNDGTYREEKQDEQKPYGQRKECEDCQFSYVGECKGDCALKINEQKSADKIDDEEYNGEDYGIDSLFHAQEILERTLGKVDGYQSDDGILEHKCAISAIKKLYKQNYVWNEEKDKKIREIIISQMEKWHEAALENNVVQDIKNSADAITWLEKKGEQKNVDSKVSEDPNSVFSKEQVEKTDKRISNLEKIYRAKLRDAMQKAADFSMTN